MAKFLVLENVVVDGATVRAGTEVDSGSTDVGRLLLSGAQLYNLAVPMPADAQRALDELRQRQAKGDPAWNSKSLFAAFALADSDGGVVTDVTASLPLSSSGGPTPNLTIANATALLAGAMSAADKARFDNLGSVQLVFRPGGVNGQGVVTTWAQVDAFANAASVPWSLFYDSSLAPTEVPATASTDFRGLMTLYATPGNPTNLVIKDGGYIKNPTLSFAAVIVCEAITRSSIELDILGNVVDLREGGRIENVAGVSLVAAVDINVASMVFACLTAGSVAANEPAAPMLNYTVPGGFYILAALVNSGGGASNFSDNSIVMDATSTLFEIHDTTTRLGPQSGVLGTIVYGPIARSEFLLWNAGPTASRPTVNLQVGAMYYDTDLKLPIWWDGTVWQSWACFAATIGDGVSTTINVVHGLNSYDVMVQVREDAAPRATVLCDVERPDPNSVDLIFLVAPNVNELRVMVKA